jgi:hypothetical protein
MDVERDLYRENKPVYYIFKYSRLAVFAVIMFTIYKVAIAFMKHHTERMAKELKHGF